jgi:hypothetical protein
MKASKLSFKNKRKENAREGVKNKMEENLQTIKTNGNGNGHVINEKSRLNTASSLPSGHISIFDPMTYMLKLPKHKKGSLPNGQVRFEKTEADYLPVAARIAWFRKEHAYWSIVTKIEQLAEKAVVMKATIKGSFGNVIATARKKPKQAFRIT